MSTPRPGETSAGEQSLNRQVVLEEDEYTEALSKIIARDFFPSLVHLDATNEYLDALHTRDPHLINASVRRLQEISSTPTPRRRVGGMGGPMQTPSQTPYGGGPSETPLRTPRGEPSTKRARYDTDMSLDNFQAKYTSEDNSSFTEILDDENRQRKEKWAWAWDAQKRVDMQRDKIIEGRGRMLIEAAPAAGVREKFRIEAVTSAGLITDKKEEADISGNQNPEAPEESEKGKEVAIKEAELEDVMAPRRDTRTAGVDGWEFKARNSLMFPPDADVTPYETSSFAAANRARGDPKVIKHGNTRLPEQEESTDPRSISAPPSPTRSRIDAAIAGTPYHPRSPTINDFSLVPTMPSPTPSELGPAAMKQLMTWGTLNATPRILSQSRDDPIEEALLRPPNTPFHLPSPSSREMISHKLSASASKSLRAKAELLQGGRTPGITKTPAAGPRRNQLMGPPTWTPRRTEGSLTPAAKRLLDRSTMGTTAARRAEAMGRMAGWEGSGGGTGKEKEKDLNHVRWTPTPGPVTRRA